MKKSGIVVVVLFVMGTVLCAQDIPSGIRMGMTYSQINLLMTNGEWQTQQGNFYIFFQKSGPTAMYTFGIDSNEGLVSLEINLTGESITDVVNKLSPKYGTPIFSDGSYIWGTNRELPNDIFAISVKRNVSASTFIDVQYIFVNALK